jgi:hypothetical protein
MDAQQAASDTGVALIAKAAPPATVSIASLAGVQVSEILVWCTLIYTVLMIGHKLWQIIKEVRSS